MSGTLKAVRGTRDLLPPETALWSRIEAIARRVFERYNFGEIRTPVFEDTSLFARSVGEETDIVSKEMYTWSDGERFEEKKMIAEWIQKNESRDRSHVEIDKINIQGTPAFLKKLNEIGVQLQVWRGVDIGSQLPGGHAELVSFRPFVSSEAISALLTAQSLAKSDPQSGLQQFPVRLRLVV